MNTSTTHTSDNAAARGEEETHQKRRMEIGFLAILQEALTVPGVVNEAYRTFQNYSIGQPDSRGHAVDLPWTASHADREL